MFKVRLQCRHEFLIPSQDLDEDVLCLRCDRMQPVRHIWLEGEAERETETVILPDPGEVPPF